MGWKFNKKNIAHAIVSPGTATMHAAHRTVGKRFRDKAHLTRKHLMPSVGNSARSYLYGGDSHYGATGSIVGRY